MITPLILPLVSLISVFEKEYILINRVNHIIMRRSQSKLGASLIYLKNAIVIGGSYVSKNVFRFKYYVYLTHIQWSFLICMRTSCGSKTGTPPIDPLYEKMNLFIENQHPTCNISRNFIGKSWRLEMGDHSIGGITLINNNKIGRLTTNNICFV